MKKSFILPIVLCAAAACSSGGGHGNDESDGPVGSLALRLSATDSQGEAYRLVNAQFVIQGYSYVSGGYTSTYTTVSSDTDPTQSVITTRLLAGYYSVTINDGWSVVHVTPAGDVPVEKSVLLSAATINTYVYAETVTPVSFSIGVNGELIDFYGGDLQIGITITQAPDATGGQGGGAASSAQAGATDAGAPL